MPEIHLSRVQALALALAALIVLTLVGRRLATDDAPAARAQLVRVERPGGASKPRLTVHVVGAVRRPGLYRLREGSRVADAVRRAGGPRLDADLVLVNLAAPVADGIQVIVPIRASPGAQASPSPTSGASAVAPKVSLGSATVEDLEELPGIGPVTAAKIVAWRQEHGAFRSVDDLDAIPGIGPARVEQLRELVTP